MLKPITLQQKEWETSYGYIWRNVINEGVASVMSGHIALPFIDKGVKAYMGPTPATLSKKIQIDFLRGELGFEGLIVSDAVPMVGFCSHAPLNDRAAGNIREGSDVILWTHPERDTAFMMEALREGRLTEERLTDAVRRVLELKARVGLIEEKEIPVLTTQDKINFQLASEEIARTSISIVRNEDNLLPLNLKQNAKILTVSVMFEEGLRGLKTDLTVIDEELKKRGYAVDHLINTPGNQIAKISQEYDAIFINVHVPPRYGCIRLYGSAANVFWNSFWLDHPCVVFTSFGDPYKIYEMPSVPNMINAYSDVEATQRAVVKVWLGEEKALGKCPIKLDGFFDIEV